VLISVASHSPYSAGALTSGGRIPGVRNTIVRPPPWKRSRRRDRRYHPLLASGHPLPRWDEVKTGPLRHPPAAYCRISRLDTEIPLAFPFSWCIVHHMNLEALTKGVSTQRPLRAQRRTLGPQKTESVLRVPCGLCVSSCYKFSGVAARLRRDTQVGYATQRTSQEAAPCRRNLWIM